MHLEVRRKGKRKHYYLAHSFRDNGKVRKVRRYLGADLTKEKIKSLRGQAEPSITSQLESYKAIKDPLHSVLSSREKEVISRLLTKGRIRANHLSEKEWEKFVEEFAFDTNAIEGSTLALPEVRAILKNGQWPQGRTKEEISETYGVREAVSYIRRAGEHISIPLIKNLHKIVFKNSKIFAGKLRGKGLEVVIADQRGNIIHKGAPQRQIVGLLKELVLWYERNKAKYHPIVLAAVVHNQFENIHPFQDGNGRVGRLLLNNILLKHGLPPVNIELKNRREYYLALQAYEKRNIRPTIELILKEYKKQKRLR